ncbi:unnamed protein product [Brachionus calyciflorus]|uniref:Uncharacterized protein n=1 Tax=Brachionus calyciflorus TaxID=104777 RepID=A0A813QM68_9BILA|nr:unnamed protein product [Brachionus calyciflorus]
MNLDKSFKCNYCKKYNDELTQLPFNKFICSDCIDFKCLNEFNHPDDNSKNVLDNANTVSVYMERIESYYKKTQKACSKDAGNIGIKLYKIKNRVQEFKGNINNYENRIKTSLSLIRYEIDSNYKNIKQSLEKKRLYFINKVNLHEQELMDNFKNTQENMKSSINQFAEKNAFWTNYLNTETMKLKENFNYEIYKSSIETQINNFLIMLNASKFLSLKPTTKNAKSDKLQFGSLEFKPNELDNRQEEEESNLFSLFQQHFKPNNSNNSLFTMESILDIKKQKGNMIKAIFTLDDDNYVLVYRQQDLTNLKLINKQGEIVKELKLEQEILAINSNGINLFVCFKDLESMDEYDTDINLSMYDHQLELIEFKQVNYVDFSEKIPIDLFVENRRVYLLTANFETKNLAIYVYSLSFDLLNSFELNHNVFLIEKNIQFFKVYVKNSRIYVKQKNLYGTRLDILDSIYGNMIKRVNFSYNFDCFCVFDDFNEREDQEVNNQFSLKISWNSDSSDDSQINSKSKLLFLSDGKYYYYDLDDECFLIKSHLNSNDKIFSNYFCLNRNNQIVSLLVN